MDETYEPYINKAKNSSSRGDVILAAGALGSPQLMMLSGIGPKEQLRRIMKKNCLEEYIIIISCAKVMLL